MKPTFLFLAIVFLVGAIFLERSEQAWPLNQPMIRLLARVTHHSLPSVTAVKMPLIQSQLLPQDVALAFRAIVSFHPRQIFVLESAGDFSAGPFSLVREASERGEIQGVPVRFMTGEIFSQQKNNFIANIHLINLEDLLLRREERERGSILPELDALFSGQTVLLGGPQVAEQAAVFENQAERKLVMMPSLGVELILLLVLLVLMTRLLLLPWIDFLLALLGSVFCCVALDAWALQARGVVWPLIVPCAFLLIAFFGKVLSCTATSKK
ncbi:MAG: hypothetical protein NT164_00015 [Verrucomicrobiae bacterium]|nr:hypothetical protein [Verrucomicrobiae bacterium]